MGASLILEKFFSRSSFYDIASFSTPASGPHLDATITSENISRSSSFHAIIFNRGPLQMDTSHVLEDFFERSKILPIIKGFQKVEREVWYFPSVVKKMKSRHKLSKNCSMHGKCCEFSGPYNFWTSVKSNIPDVRNWNLWTFLGLKTDVRGHGPPATLSPQWLCPCLSLLASVQLASYYTYYIIRGANHDFKNVGER